METTVVEQKAESGDGTETMVIRYESCEVVVTETQGQEELLVSDAQEQEQDEVTVDEKDFESNDGFTFEKGFQVIHLEKSQIEVG